MSLVSTSSFLPRDLARLVAFQHAVAKEPKQLLESGYSRIERLYDNASADYDSRIVEFFKQSLPLANDKPGQVARKK